MTPYPVLRNEVPRHLVDAVRRRLFLELRRCGVTAEDVAEWSRGSWWPSLRSDPTILAVQDDLSRRHVGEGDVWAEPQILIRLPDEDGTALGGSHVDTLPPWADELRYKWIFGVECTDTPRRGGQTLVYPDAGPPAYVTLRAGDALRMDPTLQHSGSPNLSPDPRIALFFRLLTTAPAR